LNYQDYVSKKFMSRLAETNVLENSLIIVMADHGESFKEHGYKKHNFSLFNEEIRVPFFMIHPSFEKSKIKKISSGNHVDVFPTIMDIFWN